MLGPLFVLHDTLNDDDEEVREIGASAVASITGRSSAPLKAVQDLAIWMTRTYRNSLEFASQVITRMTGEHPVAQIMLSLDQDDSLFVEESLNLFIDEVREARLWASVFRRLSSEIFEGSGSQTNNPLNILVSRVVEGLEALDTVLEKDGGALGCVSKPSTYLACLRILISTNAFLEYMATHYLDRKTSLLNFSGHPMLKMDTEKILGLLQGFVTNGLERRVHEDLIFEVLSPDMLARTNLEILAPQIPGVLKSGLTLSLQLRNARLGPPATSNVNNTI